MRHSLIITIALAVVTSGSLWAQATRSAAVQFKAAQEKEEVTGDLKGAIKDYEKIAKGSDRQLAAQALLRMASIYQLIGDAEASKVYQRLVRDFSDQTATAEIARARLGSPVTAVSAAKARRRLPYEIDGIINSGVSADGRYISTFGDSSELAIRDLRTGQLRLVTGTPADRNYEFAAYGTFSRDGKQLAFTASGPSLPRNELRLINLQEKGIPRNRTLFMERYVQPFGWTPDGKSIAVVVVTEARDARFGLVSTADGSFRPLKSFQGSFASMFVSPDGRYMAADLQPGSTERQRDLFVISLSDGRETHLEHPADDRVMGWSPDSRFVLFSSDRNTGSPALYAQAFSNGRAQGLPQMLEKDFGAVFPLGVSSSGTLFYGPSPGREPTLTDIHIAEFDFARGREISAPKLVREGRAGSMDLPAWSADGKYLAYRLIRSGQAGATLVVRSIETGDSREWPIAGNLNMLSWSADGKSLLASQTGANAKVIHVDAASGKTTEISPGVAAKTSPNGDTIYIRRPEGGSVAIIARDHVTGAERDLIRRPLGPGMWLSPDGRYIAAYLEPPVRSKELLLIPTDGGPVRQITLPQIGLAFLAWAPDNRAFLTRTMDAKEMWRIPLEGQGTKLDFDLGSWYSPNLWAVHPDGKQIAFTSVASVTQPEDSGVWVLENFLPRPESPAGK